MEYEQVTRSRRVTVPGSRISKLVLYTSMTRTCFSRNSLFPLRNPPAGSVVIERVAQRIFKSPVVRA